MTEADKVSLDKKIPLRIGVSNFRVDFRVFNVTFLRVSI